ncbi:MAG: hypothetical protein ACR2MO_08625 [Acidimicrobiales bacterium]
MSPARSQPLIGDRNTALALGVAATVLGSILLWDAWEHRGKSRPWAMRLVGLVG